MSDTNTNLTTRIPARIGLEDVEIFEMSDFPAATAGVILLDGTKNYLIKNSLVTSDRFIFPNGADLAFGSGQSVTVSLTYTGTGVLFSHETAPAAGGFINRFNIFELDIFFANPAASLFDIASNGAGTVLFTNLVFSGESIGTLANFALVVVTLSNFANVKQQGFVLNGCQLHLMVNIAIQGPSDFSGTAVAITMNGLATTSCSYYSVRSIQGPGDRFFDISPGISATAQIDLTRCFQLGPSSFFEKKDIGEFSAIANSTLVSSCTSVSAFTGGLAHFTFAAGHGFDDGDQVTHTGFTEATYNGTFLVTFTSANTYLAFSLFGAPVAFVADDTGTATRQYRVFTTTDTTGLLVGTPIKITDATTSLSNNGRFVVRSLSIGNSFSVPGTFLTTDTGKWSTDSLTEADEHVVAFNNATQKDSEKIALGNINGNATLTTFASPNVYVPLNMTGFITSIETERFFAADSTTGLFTYNGLNRFQGFVSGALGALKSGATENYRFAMSLNGGIPVFTPTGAIDITSVTSGLQGRARFVHAGVSPPVGAFATLSTFTPSSRYNTTQLVKFSTATEFELDGVLFVTNETGSYGVAAANFVPMEVKTSKIVIPLLFSAILDPGETIQIMVAGEGVTSSLTIVDFAMGVF